MTMTTEEPMSKLRGKQHWQRVDASVKAAAREVAARQAAASEASKCPPPVEHPVTAVPADAVAIRTQFGWYPVVKINAKTVTVNSDHGPWTERIPTSKIFETRTADELRGRAS